MDFNLSNSAKLDKWKNLRFFSLNKKTIMEIVKVIDKKKKRKYIKECYIVTRCLDTNLKFELQDMVSLRNQQISFQYDTI